jgi:hypothetical protein
VDFGCGQPKPSSGRQPFGFWGVDTRALAEYRFDAGYDISGFQPLWNSTGKVFLVRRCSSTQSLLKVALAAPKRPSAERRTYDFRPSKMLTSASVGTILVSSKPPWLKRTRYSASVRSLPPGRVSIVTLKLVDEISFGFR